MIFDPVLITYQIVALQCFYYLAMGTLLGVFHALFDIRISLDHLFTPKFVNFVSTIGWIETICTLASAVAGYEFILRLHFPNSKLSFLGLICCQ